MDFEPSEKNPRICVCGHKCSVHHSDAAYMTNDEQAVLAGLGNSGGLGPEAVSLGMSREPGMELVTRAVFMMGRRLVGCWYRRGVCISRKNVLFFRHGAPDASKF